MDGPASPLRAVPWVMVHTSGGPVLYGLQLLSGYRLRQEMVTADTATCTTLTPPSLPDSHSYQHDILDYSCTTRGQAPHTQPPPHKDVQWEMIAEFPTMPRSNPSDVTPSCVTGTPKEEALDLSTHKAMPVLVKEETPERADNSLDGPPLLHHHDSPPPPHPTPHSLGSTATPTISPRRHHPPLCDAVDRRGRYVTDRRQSSWPGVRTPPSSLPLLTKTEAPHSGHEPSQSPPVLQPVSSRPLLPTHSHHPPHYGQSPDRCVSPSTASSTYYRHHLVTSGVRNIGRHCAARQPTGTVLDLRTPHQRTHVLFNGESRVFAKEPLEPPTNLHSPLPAPRLPPQPHSPHHHHPVSSYTISSDSQQSAQRATTCPPQGEVLDLSTRQSTPPAPTTTTTTTTTTVTPTVCVQPPPPSPHHHHLPTSHPKQPSPPHAHRPRSPSPPHGEHTAGPPSTFSPEARCRQNGDHSVGGTLSQEEQRGHNYSPISSASTETCPEDRMEIVEEELEEEEEAEEEEEEGEREESGEPGFSTLSDVDGKPKRVGKKPGRKKGQVSRVLHLWEFILDLLRDPRHCPRIIHWENRAEGVFRVLHSAEVARLWGEKKRNKKVMTYEKLSRSLRYSRKEGFFDALPKGHSYPKKLCFKFGPRSYGWRSDAG